MISPSVMQNFILESIDRCGKDTLVSGLLNKLGFRFVFHRSKPPVLDFYVQMSKDTAKDARFLFQRDCFISDMALLKTSEQDSYGMIFNRSWLGESVYANMYRGYDGNYVFDLEKIAGIHTLQKTRLILLTEDFDVARHFVDDGESLGPIEKRAEEQARFIEAFNRSIIMDKRIICVTDPETGGFKSKDSILSEALA